VGRAGDGVALNEHPHSVTGREGWCLPPDLRQGSGVCL